MLASQASVGAVFLCGAAILLVAAGLLARVRVEAGTRLVARERESIRDLCVAGFGAIARAPRPRLLVGLAAAQAFVRGCLNVLIVVVVYHTLDGGAAEVGYLTAAMGAGGCSERWRR